MQRPVRHSIPLAHCAPFAFLQSLSAVQPGGHWPSVGPQGTTHLPWEQVKLPVQLGVALAQQGCPLPPHGAQLPSLASVFPAQQVPPAQPRSQGVSWKPLPSLAHCRTDVPSQVRAWVGSQALQSCLSTLHPRAQVCDVVPDPSGRQVSKVFPLHVLALGAQVPAHNPSLHTLEHAVPSFTHSPPSVQRCGVVSAHRRWPGAHSPVQSPALHTKGQDPATSQVPPAAQNWRVSPSHRFVPGVQSPLPPPGPSVPDMLESGPGPLVSPPAPPMPPASVMLPPRFPPMGANASTSSAARGSNLQVVELARRTMGADQCRREPRRALVNAGFFMGSVLVVKTCRGAR
jgi:hypothetical protein